MLFLAGAHERARTSGRDWRQPRLIPLRAVGGQRRPGRDRDRPRRVGQRAMPVGNQTVRRPVRHLLERCLHVAAAAGGAKQRSDDVIAVRSAEVGPEGLTPAVREVPRVFQVAELGQAAGADRVPHPHRRVRIHIAQRDILRHPFDEPERDAVERCGHVAASDTRDVVLERVGQLVTDHVVGFERRCAQWQEDTPLEALRDTFTSLHLGDIGLVVRGVVRVKNQRLTTAQLVAQHSGYSRVPPFGHAGRLSGSVGFLIIEIDVEVLGLQNLEVEGLVLDSVTAEGLCWCCGREHTQRPQQQRDASNGVHVLELPPYSGFGTAVKRERLFTTYTGQREFTCLAPSSCCPH